MDGITIVGNHILGNRVGLYFDNSPSAAGVTHDIVGNLFAYNDIGAQFLPSVKGNVFVGNSFIDNREQVGVKGSGDFEGNNTFTVDGLGNHWSDFAGYDADADGVGDISYELADLFSAFTDDNPDLHFFDGTPAARAVDLAGHMFPAFRPRPKVTDTAPLVEPPSIPSPIPAPPSGSSLSTGLAALAMVGLALAMWSVAKAPIRRGAR
jgi:nitrous oxidase accessory protein